MIIQQQHGDGGDRYWLAQQRINGQPFLAEGETRHGAMTAMFELTRTNRRPQLSPEEAAEKLGYARCMQDWKYGVAVWESNPYPPGSPEYLGWKTAVGVLADKVRMQA